MGAYDEDAYRCALNDDYEGFIAARKKLILNRVMELCEVYEEETVVAEEAPLGIKKGKEKTLEYEQMNLGLW